MELTTLSQGKQRNVIIPGSRLEHRRVLGSLRERTVFINSNCPCSQQMCLYDDIPNTPPNYYNRTYALPEKRHSKRKEMKENMRVCSDRINEYVNNILKTQENSIEEKLSDISSRVEKAKELHEKIENRLYELQKLILEKKINIPSNHERTILPMQKSTPSLRKYIFNPN